MPGYLLPWFTAAEEGLFGREGVEVVLCDLTGGGAAIVHAVASGEVDCAEIGVSHVLGAIERDGPVYARFAFMVERRSHMAAIVVRDRLTGVGRRPETLGDLEGATVVGSLQSQFTRELLAALRRVGVEPGPLVETPYGEVMQALAAGRGDVAADWVDLLPDFARKALPFGAEPVAISLNQAGLPAQYSSGFLVNGEVLRSRQVSVARFRRGLAAGMIAARRDPSSGLTALLRAYPAVDEELALAQWRTGDPIIFSDGEDDLGSMDPDTWANTLAFDAEAHGRQPIDPLHMYDPLSLVHEHRPARHEGPAPAEAPAGTGPTFRVG